MNNNANHFRQFIRDYAALKMQLPRMYGIEAVNLFKANFDAEGFIAGEGRLQKWDKPKHPTGRKTLTKTRALRKAIRIKSTSTSKVVVGVEGSVKYAELHNFGGKVEVTPKMRRYFWAMYKQKGDAYWKSLALTKKTHFEFPERKFIGNTLAMKPRLDRRTIKELKKMTSKYK